MYLICALGRKLVAKLQHHALGGFLANSRDPGQPCNVVSANGTRHVVCRHAAEDRDPELGPDSAYGDEFLEKLLLLRPTESIQRKLVLAHVRMDVQGNFASHRGELGKRRNGNS